MLASRQGFQRDGKLTGDGATCWRLCGGEVVEEKCVERVLLKKSWISQPCDFAVTVALEGPRQMSESEALK